jgi:hypothetical protein
MVTRLLMAQPLNVSVRWTRGDVRVSRAGSTTTFCPSLALTREIRPIEARRLPTHRLACRREVLRGALITARPRPRESHSLPDPGDDRRRRSQFRSLARLHAAIITRARSAQRSYGSKQTATCSGGAAGGQRKQVVPRARTSASCPVTG